MINEKFRDFLYKNAGYAVVFLTCGVYLATAFVRIDKTGKTVAQIIIDSVVIFIIGFFINRIFDLQGLMIGERDERYQDAVRLHSEAVVEVSPYLSELDDWCFVKNEENKRIQRIRVLSREGLRYDDCFEKDGAFKESCLVDVGKVKSRTMKKFYKRRNKCIDKALRLKLTPLSAGELTSEGTNSDDPFYFGRTKRTYEQQAAAKAALTKGVSALIFGYYGVSLIEDFSYANLIWTALQVVMFILIGVVAMYNAHYFITNEHRTRMVKKVNYLEMFDGQKEKYINKEEI